MPITLQSNPSASFALDSLRTVSSQFQKSLIRLSSGNRIGNPSDDAGGLAVSMRISAAIKRQAAASSNIASAMSYVQTRDGALATADQVLSRMGELKVLSLDVTKNTGDLGNYETEFQALRAQLNALTGETFNGLSLFSTETLSVSTTADGTKSVDLTGVDLLGSSAAPFAAFESDFSSLDGFTDASQGTATASLSGGQLRLETNSNDLAKVEMDLPVSGAWEMRFDFSKTSVPNDDLSVTVGGVEVFSYDAADAANHTVRIVYDGTSAATVYLDGASSAFATNTVGAVSGKVGLQMTSTVPGAESLLDDFSIASSVSSNQIGAVAGSSTLAALNLTALRNATGEIAAFRAEGGAQQSRLKFAQDQLTVNQTNLEAANSRINDVDIAAESTNLARLNILQQAGATMLSQSNQSQRIALRLLG